MKSNEDMQKYAENWGATFMPEMLYRQAASYLRREEDEL